MNASLDLRIEGSPASRYLVGDTRLAKEKARMLHQSGAGEYKVMLAPVLRNPLTNGIRGVLRPQTRNQNQEPC